MVVAPRGEASERGAFGLRTRGRVAALTVTPFNHGTLAFSGKPQLQSAPFKEPQHTCAPTRLSSVRRHLAVKENVSSPSFFP
nr:hypothetical protein [Candidatus Freyrarchaeum guaymaensis]